MKKITTVEGLEELYGFPVQGPLIKELNHINHHYRQFIEASPFLILATYGPKGIDCSPRGDPAGFVRIIDSKTIMMPDRRGNKRLDSLKNIVGNPEVGLIFLIPGIGETLRIAGKAEILLDDDLNQSFAIEDKPAHSVIQIKVDKVYIQCQKALVRSNLWDPKSQIDRSTLPSGGEMAKNFAAMHGQELDAEKYNRDYPEHMKKTIY